MITSGITLTPVFSTSVEVFLSFRFSNDLFVGLLHVRGGVSITGVGTNETTGSSLRPWRCFQRTDLGCVAGQVFSTSVEVFLQSKVALKSVARLLH